MGVLPVIQRKHYTAEKMSAIALAEPTPFVEAEQAGWVRLDRLADVL